MLDRLNRGLAPHQSLLQSLQFEYCCYCQPARAKQLLSYFIIKLPWDWRRSTEAVSCLLLHGVSKAGPGSHDYRSLWFHLREDHRKQTLLGAADTP